MNDQAEQGVVESTPSRPAKDPGTRREPWLAVALSLLSSGVGHIYCGRIVSGVALFSAWLLLLPVCYVTIALVPPSTTAIIVSAGPVLAWLLVWLGGAWRASRRARQSTADYQLRDYNRPIVYALFISIGLVFSLLSLVACRISVAEAFYIPTSSMQPTCLPGDRILCEKLSLLHRPPRRGDLVVFRRVDNQPGYYIKRVVGLPGDTVRIDQGKVWINGQALEQQVLSKEDVDFVTLGLDSTKRDPHMVVRESSGNGAYVILLRPTTNQRGQAKFETVVPERNYFVMGDNRNNSRDSRHFGSVPLSSIIGRATYRLVPAVSWKRFGPIQ